MAKRAYLVGCNYPGSSCPLNGCINDVMAMKSMLVTYYGFSEGDVTVHIDTNPSSVKPTGANMKAKLKELVAATRPEDILFFHFSGHGTQCPTPVCPEEPDGFNEALVPTDLNLIMDDDLRVIFAALPLEARFTMVADCCHSGTLLDGPHVVIGGNKDGTRDTDIPDLSALAGVFGLKEFVGPLLVDGELVKNRSLPASQISTMLSQLLGKQVDPANLKRGLTDAFGGNASVAAQHYGKAAMDFYKQEKARSGGQTPGCSMDLFVRLIKHLCANKMASQPAGGAVSGGHGGEPTFAAPAGGAAASSSGVGHLNPATGCLITGCRDKETSADACPSGDKNKAYGALTNALTTVVAQHHQTNPNAPLNYRALVTEVRMILQKTGFAQNPCLECMAESAEQPFITH